MESMAQVKAIFEQHDTEGHGKIRQADMLRVLTQIGGFSAETVDVILKSAASTDKEFIDYNKLVDWILCDEGCTSTIRVLSLPIAVVTAGGLEAWNEDKADVACLGTMLQKMCSAHSVDRALAEVRAVMSLGHNLWAYAYMRKLYDRNPNLYYSLLLAHPSLLLPVVYTPTVGEACQKFGSMPLYRRGCYLSIEHRGKIRSVLQEYAEAELSKGPDGAFQVDCIVFSDGGRILGLGDLGAWGMGIPIGKLDLYTVCAGVNPFRTIPVIVDAGCSDQTGNTHNLLIREHPNYTGLKCERVTHTSAAGTKVNSAYYGENNLISEFMEAAVSLFGDGCLLQFEDFNSNDAFPLLAEFRKRFVCYNDDIQGTAAVVVAALLGAMKIQDPTCSDLVARLREQTFLFHGAGSASIGTMKLMRDEAGVPASAFFVTNSRGLIWRAEDSEHGNYRNDEQKEFARIGEPQYNSKDLSTLVKMVKPTCIIGAVGVVPNCFTRDVVKELLSSGVDRPVTFALSNPKTQAEITFENACAWSNGKIIYGSGTAFAPLEMNGIQREAGQVNNVYIFPGVSFGVVCCRASSIPDVLFMHAAEAVAHSLSPQDLAKDRVVPHPDNLREVGLNVATSVVLKCQEIGIARTKLGTSAEEVRIALRQLMWSPKVG